MLLRGIGTDMIEIERVRNAVARRGQAFLDRIFTAREQDYCFQRKNPYPSLAARFAAKEAVLKAMGKGLADGIRWNEVEVLKNQEGKPQVVLAGRAARICDEMGVCQVEISLSHCASYATAVAVIIINNPKKVKVKKDENCHKQ